MDSRVKHLVNCLILKYKCISENEAYQITKEIKEKKGTKFENLYDIDFLELAKPHVCNKLKDKSILERKQAGLSRATLEISSEFSSNIPLRTLRSSLQLNNFEVLFHWRKC